MASRKRTLLKVIILGDSGYVRCEAIRRATPLSLRNLDASPNDAV
jgi:hypothetical protein